MKKLIGLKVIIIISCLTSMATANTSGFIFDWQPFFVNADLALNNPGKEVLIKNLSVADISMPISGDSRYIFSLYPDQNSDSTSNPGKKSALSDIKISFSPASPFMTPRNETYANSDDEQISKIVNGMTSLIYDDSKIKSLETISKIIEPQVNLYFEF